MWTVLDSPVGPLRLVEHDDALSKVEFTPFAPTTEVDEPACDVGDAPAVLVAAAQQLTAYFAGDLTVFDLPLAPVGTAFQQRVWEQLREIGYGRTATYGQVAGRLGLTNAASRAVGLANGRNPVPIVIPCHRVIGADGTLTGYAGGLERKRLLLDLESSAAALF